MLRLHQILLSTELAKKFDNSTIRAASLHRAAGNRSLTSENSANPKVNHSYHKEAFDTKCKLQHCDTKRCLTGCDEKIELISLGHLTSKDGQHYADKESKKIILLNQHSQFSGKPGKQYLAAYSEPVPTPLDEVEIDPKASDYLNQKEIFKILERDLPVPVGTRNGNNE
jgi:hypothetical protein